MGTRVELRSKLEELLGSKEVYYNRPEDRLMEYPAIVYSKIKPRTAHAGNSIYKIDSQYELTVISNRPDNPVLDKLIQFPYCAMDRLYKADNLYHNTFTLYY